MAILPIRKLGSVGIVKDVDPFDLPVNAFSSGVNVRFANGVVQRGPVFRLVRELSGDASFIDSLSPLTGLDYIIVGLTTGQIYSIAGATITNITAAGWTPSSIPTQSTSCNLSDVYYINREDRVPWYVNRGTLGAMTAMPTSGGLGWNANWRCKSLRAFNGQLIAIGMTEGTDYPTTLRWSDVTVVGAPPIEWVPSTTNSAGRTTLAEMVNPLIDGMTLRNSFILYSRDETWAMEPSLDDNIYNFRRIFTNTGVINKNCVVELEGKHYVFGFEDIFVHDGVQKKSIAEGRVRQYIYRTMNKKYADKFFTILNRSLNEIMFCYVSGDELVDWPGNGQACNRAAVYNYVADTWTFYDLPMSLFAGLANLDTSLVWNDATNSWDLTGGSWMDNDDGFKRNVMFVGINYGDLTPKIHSFEAYDTGSNAGPVDITATTSCFARRDSIDLDEIQAELRGWKNIVSIYPQGRVFQSGMPLTFQFGSSVLPDESPTLGDPMTYDGDTDYKLDYRDAGRYLSMQIIYDDFKSFQIGGLDIDVVITGSR
jgi:hypothetical protein